MNRVIPCLLLKSGGLVKTIRFGDPKYVGDPINAIRIFNEKEVDELVVLDIEASKAQRLPDFDLLRQIAGECFMPLTYGGGITTIEQARTLFALGIEKICIQTSALRDISFISRLADCFGSQSVVVSIDVKKSIFGVKRLYSSYNKELLKKSWLDQLVESVEAGAGEIFLNSVDLDGTMSGMDLEIIKLASRSINVPLIATGGVGSLADIKAGVGAGASAIGVGSFFVFHGPLRAVLITYPTYHELEELLTGRGNSQGTFNSASS